MKYPGVGHKQSGEAKKNRSRGRKRNKRNRLRKNHPVKKSK